MSPSEPLPTDLERRISERWKVWVPWVRMQQLRVRDYDSAAAAADSCCLRQRHSEHMVDMMRASISMRTIRRHRLDDPRLANEVRAVMIEAAKVRQSKARFRRSEEQRKRDMLATLIRIGSVVSRAATTYPDSESHGDGSQPARVVLDPLAVPAAIQTIRQHVCAHFYLREMRDPDLTARTHRRAYVLPRQIAIYIARQLTGASLQEIGREFAGRHHSTVLHALRKIEEMRRADKALDAVIARLMDAVSCRHEDWCWAILATATSRTRPRLVSGWGCLGRRLFTG